MAFGAAGWSLSIVPAMVRTRETQPGVRYRALPGLTRSIGIILGKTSRSTVRRRCWWSFCAGT
ncbi:hypothetical protein MASR2M8_06520 [Opitutaceae bacterium]